MLIQFYIYHLHWFPFREPDSYVFFLRILGGKENCLLLYQDNYSLSFSLLPLIKRLLTKAIWHILLMIYCIVIPDVTKIHLDASGQPSPTGIYAVLSSNDLVVLPSARLLRLYKNVIHQKPGLNSEIFS